MARRRSKPAPEPVAPPVTELDPVTLVPTGEAFIGGVPAVEITVPADRVADLLSWFPPAFVVKPPAPAATTTEES